MQSQAIPFLVFYPFTPIIRRWLGKPASRFKSDIRIKPEKAQRVAARNRGMCEAPDCIRAGNCRVPKSRDNLHEYFWYCAAHARAHNEAWDFFKGMGDDDIQRFREEALIRPPPHLAAGQARRPGADGPGPADNSMTAMRCLQRMANRHGAPSGAAIDAAADHGDGHAATGP